MGSFLLKVALWIVGICIAVVLLWSLASSIPKLGTPPEGWWEWAGVRVGSSLGLVAVVYLWVANKESHERCDRLQKQIDYLHRKINGER